jgi:hypothetical protein
MLAAAAVAGAGAKTSAPLLSFRVFANTGRNLDAILWTGTRFLYVENTANTIWSAPAAGLPLRQFASMPRIVEETRCVLSPGTHGFPAGAVFCHSPDDKIYEISETGAVTLFATLPVPAGTVSDGAIDWDRVGKFGYHLVAATGRSGAGQAPGGIVFTISSTGTVSQVGTYTGPGADELLIAPARFGSAGGQALLTLDAGPTGELVAMDASGKTRTLVPLPGGLNPIAVIPPSDPAAKGSPPAGFYVTNDVNPDVYFAPVAPLAPYAGDLVVGSEMSAQFWVIAPRGTGFRALPLRDTLRGSKYSLEGAVFVS